MLFPPNFSNQPPPAFAPSAGGMGRLAPPLAPRRRYGPMALPAWRPGSAPPPPPGIPPFFGGPSRNERALIDFLNPIFSGPGTMPTYF